MIAKPFHFQKEDIHNLETYLQGRALWSIDMGLGKTLMSLWFIARERIETQPAIIVCPASVKYHWEHELITHLGRRCTVLEGQTVPKHNTNGSIFGHEKIIIINYDILHYWLDHLIRLKAKTLFIDESQYLINRSSKRTKAVKELSKKVKNVIALSGTPLLNRPSELWPTLNILWPSEFPSFWTFGQQYCKPRRGRWGWEFKGAENLPHLHARLKALGMVRRRKKDVASELPPKLRQVVPCKLSDYKEYTHARDDFASWIYAKSPAKAKSAQRAEEVTKLGYLLRLIAKLKVPAITEWATKFLEETDEKLVLFTYHRSMTEALSNSINYKHIVVDGSVTGRKRKAAVDQFQQDPSTRLLIGNLLAAGVGINLTAASHVGFTELFWRPGDFLQAEDRPHRFGQKLTLWITYLVAQGTLEEDLCKILHRKQEVISKILDGENVQNDFDVFDELLDTIKTKEKK